MIFFNAPKFKDMTYQDEHVKLKWGLSKLNPRFRTAQIWLEREIMTDMAPVVPYRTGVFLNTLQMVNQLFEGDGKVRTALPAYKHLYSGISKTGRPFNWTNKKTQPYWGTYTMNMYRAKYKSGVEEILHGRNPK